MKNKTKIFVAVLLAIAIIFSLTACGEERKAENTVNSMLSAFKSLDFESIKMYMDTDSDNDTGNEALEAEFIIAPLAENLEYRIISSEKTDDNTVIVKTEIITINMKPIMGDFLVKAIQYSFGIAFSSPQPTEEEMNQKFEELFVESIKNTEHETVTNEVDVKVMKNENNEWKVQADDDFLNALLGGLIDAVREMEESWNQQ